MILQIGIVWQLSKIIFLKAWEVIEITGVLATYNILARLPFFVYCV